MRAALLTLGLVIHGCAPNPPDNAAPASPPADVRPPHVTAAGEHCMRVASTAVETVWIRGAVVDRSLWGDEGFAHIILTDITREGGDRFILGDTLAVFFECASPPVLRGTHVVQLAQIPLGTSIWVFVTGSATGRGGQTPRVGGFAIGTD